MDTTPFGTPAPPPAPTPPAAAPGVPSATAARPWTRSPLVLGCAGLGVLVLAAGAVLLTTGQEASPVAALPVATSVPTATPTTAPTTGPAAPTTGPAAPVVPAVAAGRNPFFALVLGKSSAGTPASAATASAAGSSGAGAGSVTVRVVPGPTVTQQVLVPGPTVTRTVPAPTPSAVPLQLTYVGPDSGVPGSGVFRLTRGDVSQEASLAPGEAFAESGPLSWLVLTRIGDDGHAVVTGGATTYDLAPGVATALT